MVINFFGIMAVIVAVALSGLATFLAYRGHQSKSWEAVNSHQQDVTVETRERKSKNTESSTKYSPKLSYSYRVNATDYTSDRIRFGGVSSNSFTSEQEATASLNRYTQEDDLTVYYNPSKPEDAVLEPGIQWQPIMILFIAGDVFLIIGIAIFFL